MTDDGKQEGFSGQAGIITGAGDGMGKEMARRLSSRGAAVVVADIDFEAARAVQGEIEAREERRLP